MRVNPYGYARTFNRAVSHRCIMFEYAMVTGEGIRGDECVWSDLHILRLRLVL